MKLKSIYESIRRLSESSDQWLLDIRKNKFIDDLTNEIRPYDTSEAFLRGGGLSWELLCRMAFGFAEEDVVELYPGELKVRWKDDIENVKYGIKHSGLPAKEWAKGVDLSEPIEVSLRNNRGKPTFYIEDGHHRYTAAKLLGKKLNVSLDIQMNPISYIAPNLGYDEFSRKLFDTLKHG